MIKKVLLAIFLTGLFLVAFAAGSFLHPFGVTHILASRGLGVRVFVWDGVLVMLGVYGVALLAEALGRRLQELAPWTTGSLVVAGVVGYLLRLGFVTREF